MRKFFALLLFLISFHILAQAKCPLLSLHNQEIFNYGGYDYTPFWAQEYVGVDLVKAEMRPIPWAQAVPFVVLDTGFVSEFINLSTSTSPQVDYGDYHHGTCVANIINGKGPYGASEQVNYLALVGTAHLQGYEGALNSLLDQNKIPKIISNSMKWNSDFSLLVSTMDEVGSIWVTSAGNHYPTPLPEYKDNSGAILVGSLRPNGFQADSSQASANLTILAPSNNQIASIGVKGEHRKFGGTSGAAPLVSGSLANVASLLPDLTLDQAKILLDKTAITTANQIVAPEENPAGLLNSYKLFRVAKRIARFCGRHLGRVDLNCENDLIKTDSTYKKFITEHELSELRDQLERAFPKCFGKWGKDVSNCSQKKELFDKLRKTAFLEPGRSEHWQHLSCITAKYNYPGNANFYSNLAAFRSVDDVDSMMKKILVNGCYPKMHLFREIILDEVTWINIFSRLIKEKKCLEYTLDTIINVGVSDQKLLHQVNNIFKSKRESFSVRKLAVQILLKTQIGDRQIRRSLINVFSDHRESDYLRKAISYTFDLYDKEAYEEALRKITNNKRDSLEWRSWAAAKLEEL